MIPQLPVIKLDQAGTGVFKMAMAYADCRSEMGSLFNVEPEMASVLVEERCSPLRRKLQDLLDGIASRISELPEDGPVVVFIRALALLAVIRKGHLRLL